MAIHCVNATNADDSTIGTCRIWGMTLNAVPTSVAWCGRAPGSAWPQVLHSVALGPTIVPQTAQAPFISKIRRSASAPRSEAIAKKQRYQCPPRRRKPKNRDTGVGVGPTEFPTIPDLGPDRCLRRWQNPCDWGIRPAGDAR